MSSQAPAAAAEHDLAAAREQDLREREERINIALESAGLGVWDWDILGNAITWDERTYALHGLTSGAFEGNYEAGMGVVHPEDRERLHRELTQALEADATSHVEYRVVWPGDASIHTLAARGKVYRDEAGRPVRLAGVCWDITERRQTEERLNRERNYMRALMENLPDRIYFKDAAGRFLRVNPTHARRLKLADPQEARGRTDFEFFTPEHAQAAWDDEQQVLKTGLPLIGKIERETMTDGDFRWLSTTKMPLTDELGRIIGTFGVSRDITEFKRANAALRESEERYGRLLNSVNDYVYSVQLHLGQVISTVHGPGCLAVTSYSPEEFQADAWLWHRIIHPDDREEVVAHTRRMVQGKEPVTFEHRIVTRDQEVRWVRNKQVPRYNAEGHLVSYDGLVSNITERMLAEIQLREANAKLTAVLADLTRSHEELKSAQMQLIQAEKLQSIGRLAAGIAHEVKNPLALLQMGLHCLADPKTMAQGEAAGILKEMEDAVTRANSVIGDLLDFSSPKDLELRTAEVNPLIQQALRFVRHDLMHGKIRVVTHLQENLQPCSIDRSKLEQVFVNVFTNACHAMPARGTLTITTGEKIAGSEVVELPGENQNPLRPGDRVVFIEVADTGTGIAPDQLSKIFDPFFTTKPEGQGTGLGLAVCRKIVDLHGGYLTVRNGPEIGAIVEILLRPAEAGAKSEAAIPPGD
ncbi:MAG: hypothetical protein QOE70_4710 [Chthoniobacter sp.]|jgi:PAS domain S-box-containing protein|nr:hypothetical protein [Chthoniobacter sp.]